MSIFTRTSARGFEGLHFCDSLTCISWVARRPFQAFLAATVGLALGVGLYFLANMLVASAFPGDPQLISAPQVQTHADGSRTLSVHYAMDDKGTCIRDGIYSLTRWVQTSDGWIKVHRPLGPFQNGENTSEEVQDYLVQIYVPPDIARTKWIFNLRIIYTCGPLLLIHRQWNAPPVEIDFGR